MNYVMIIYFRNLNLMHNMKFSPLKHHNAVLLIMQAKIIHFLSNFFNSKVKNSCIILINKSIFFYLDINPMCLNMHFIKFV